MLNLTKVFNTAPPALTKDEVAKFLRCTPEALDAFEKAYAKKSISASDDFFSVSAKEASKTRNHEITESTEDVENRIVRELLGQTEVFSYDGKTTKKITFESPDEFVQLSEIEELSPQSRPQLTGNFMKVDISGPSYPALLFCYKEYLNETNKKKKKFFYDHFRQGLDILDLDPVLYKTLELNPNSMGNWFPQLVEACKNQEFFKIPATKIAKVPLPLLQLTRQEFQGLTQTTMNIVDKWAMKAFGLDLDKDYFVKTGTYSSKFDFRNAYVKNDAAELGEYLLYIHGQATNMASPLCQPSIYGVSTTNEWVVREFIYDKENNPCIYKGLPLHCEYRIFVDCDKNQVIGMMPYWEPETMKQRFGHEADADSPHQIHDYIIYVAHEPELMRRYEENKEAVRNGVQAILPHLKLSGQWSIDVMQNGDDFYLIDMARAENSAFYECVPKELRRPSTENWLPEI